MQENIETKNIGNRKFIIELRFDPKVSMLDKKGKGAYPTFGVIFR